MDMTTLHAGGRPRKAHPKHRAILVKLSDAELALMKERAAEQKKPLATYLREAGLR